MTKFEKNVTVKYECIKHKKKMNLKITYLQGFSLTNYLHEYAVRCPVVVFIIIIFNQPFHFFLGIANPINIVFHRIGRDHNNANDNNNHTFI